MDVAGVKRATFISSIAGKQTNPASDMVEIRLNSDETNAGWFALSLPYPSFGLNIFIVIRINIIIEFF